MVNALEVAGPSVWAVQWEQGAGWQEWPLGYLAISSRALRWEANLAVPEFRYDAVSVILG